jgi:DNA repair exonuclease SbcCD ATPase subunit
MKKIKKNKKKPIKKVKSLSKKIALKKIKNKKSKIKVKKNQKVRKLKKNKIIKKKFKLKKTKTKTKKKVKKKVKAKKNNQISSKTRQVILGIIRLQDRLTPNFKFNFSLDRFLLSFFQSISVTIDNFKSVLAEERERKKQLKIKLMELEKIQKIKKNKLDKELAQKEKEKELKEEATLERERKKELQKFIRIEQAQVRKEQADKQRKFLEQIRLEKKIEQFRKREALEIQNLEKFVLSQERDSYAGVEERIEKIKQKYQALRDQKIRERVEQLGITVEEGEGRSALLEKERQYNLGRQKIEYALESYYRSAHSLCFQINKRYIPKYLNILRVIDRRFETGEIFIKWDDAPDEDWLILIYIKDNSPEEGIVIEDKSNSEKNASHEFKTNEIFKASDLMVDSLTNLLDRERKKRKAN